MKVGESLAHVTFNKRLSYLRRCLDWAVSSGKVATNHYAVVKSRKVIKDPVKPFTQDEVTCIMNGFRSLSPAYVPFVAFMLLTGARMSEAIGIQWKRIDFGRGEITIADSLPCLPDTSQEIQAGCGLQLTIRTWENTILSS